MKIFTCILALALAFSLAGCRNAQSPESPATPTPGGSPAPSSPSVSTPSSNAVQTDTDAAPPATIDELGPVAGAALYRGTITEIVSGTPDATGGDAAVICTLEQAAGSNYGYQTLQVTVDEHTRSNSEMDELQAGQYVEVYYGVPMGGGIVQPVAAIQLKKFLLGAESLVFNGEVISVTPPADIATNGSMLLKKIGGEGEIETVVHFGEGTQIYMNLDDVKEGVKLNIFTNGIAAMSFPPQITALEIRPYAEPEETAADNTASADSTPGR